MLSPVPGPTTAPCHSPATSPGPSTAGTIVDQSALGVDEREKLRAIRVRRRRPVPGARRIAAIGRERAGQPKGQPVMRQHDVGEALPRRRVRAPQPRQLGDRETRHQHRAAGLRPGPPSAGKRSISDAASGADSVSFHSLAGRITSHCASRATIPCCCPPTLIAATPGEPACCHADSNAAHHAAGSCSDRGGWVGGCGADPRPTTSPLSRSRTSTLVALVDECELGMALSDRAVRRV